MGSTGALQDPALLATLLRSLSQQSTMGTPQVVPGMFPAGTVENIMRALATLPILADLQIGDSVATGSKASGSRSILEPLVSPKFPKLPKLPGLFDVKGQ